MFTGVTTTSRAGVSNSFPAKGQIVNILAPVPHNLQMQPGAAMDRSE